MSQSPHLRRALRLLEADLYGWKMPPKGTTLRVEAPPPVTDESYFGVKLSDVATPGCTAEPRTLALTFDALVKHHLEGSPAPVFTRRVAHFVGTDPARFVLWAAQHRFMDLDMDLSAGRVLALGEYTFGLADGLAVCESGTPPFTFNPVPLTQPLQLRCRERGFTALYLTARERDNREAMRCLAAIRAYHPAAWRQIAPWAWHKTRRLSNESTLSAIVAQSEDPLVELYAELVPRVLSRARFESQVMPLSERVLNPDEDYRRRLWRLVRRFA